MRIATCRVPTEDFYILSVIRWVVEKYPPERWCYHRDGCRCLPCGASTCRRLGCLIYLAHCFLGHILTHDRHMLSEANFKHRPTWQTACATRDASAPATAGSSAAGWVV